MNNINIENPSEEIRNLMIEELENDNEKYVPKTIYQDKVEEYWKTLKECFTRKTLKELKQEIKDNFINPNNPHKKINSGETLAENEWNKYYQKAICKIAIKDNKKVRIVRWKSVMQPKNLLNFTEGKEHHPNSFYNQIGQFQPLGPNSGLTIELI